MDWSIKITKTSNGYYIVPGEDCEGSDSVIEVVDTDNETKDEQIAFMNLCYELKDFFGINNDKHANDGEGQYLRIKVDNDDS